MLSKTHSHQGGLFQEEGRNYPHWGRTKEEFGYKPNPQDYESDDSVSLDEKTVKKTTIIS